MAQHVRMQVLAKLAHAGLTDPQLDGPRAEATTLLANEYRAIGRVGQRTYWQPGLQGLACLAPDR